MRRPARWFDDRLGLSRFGRTTLNKIFPDNWSFMLGEIALYSFVVLVLTGIFLAFFFEPSGRDVIYHGQYVPLRGVKMTAAYESTIRISFDVRAGLVMRQMHHWAALLFVCAIVAHLCRIFFTGAFRRPREINWIVGLTLLLLVLFNGFAGYSLPDDLLSGLGLRIAFSIVQSVPLVGVWAAFFVFGGEFPADAIYHRLYVLHIFIVPVAIATLLGAHMAILWRQKHTQFPGPGKTEDNVVGSHLWPSYTMKTLGLLFLVFSVTAGLGGLAQINPIWLYGPFEAWRATTYAQPDWYVGWLEGALRLFPPWELSLFGRYEIPEVFFPAVLLPLATFGLLYLWPFLERRVTHDRAPHHLLDRPRDRPVRTALGFATLSFYAVLLFAGGQDVIATKLQVGIVPVLWTFRVLLFALPPVVGLITWKVCRDLRRAERRHEGPDDSVDLEQVGGDVAGLLR
jgi:ubiquinol-cytochrome c reductase cytochrome b subunit